MKRREFIKKSGATAAAAATMSVPGMEAVAATGQKIIVIGAGMAGLSAAQKLKANGNTVTILEARNRIGGRIYTSTKWTDAPTDLGASWVHEKDGNPLTTVAQQAGVSLVTTDYASFVTYNKTAGKIANGTGSRYKTIEGQYDSAVKAGYNSSTDQNTRTFIENYVKYTSMTTQDKELLNHFVVSWGDDDYGGDAAEMGTWYWDAMSTYAGLDAVPVGGYKGIINYLAQGQNILFNKIVTKIAYTTTGGTVTCADGTTYTGDRIVVTLPLGVLKKGSVVFSPALSSSKQNAINKLGMTNGVLQKVFLRFASKFWDDVDWIEYVPSVANRGKFHQWLNCYRISGGIPILLAFNGGYYAINEDAKTDTDIVADAMSVLREMYGTSIPDPIDYQIPHWHNDPYAYGSYSYHPVGATPSMRTTLASAINNRVFFAGEATHKNYWATAHGAYLSGQSVADAIAKL